MPVRSLHRLCSVLLLFALVFARVAAGAEDDVLTTIRAVRLLTPERAGASLAVRLEGVVTCVNASNSMLWLQDGADGIYIRGSAPQLLPGDRVILEGLTRFGKFSPSITAPDDDKINVTKLASGPLPTPVPTTLTDAMTGARHDVLVTLSGVVRSVKVERGLRGSHLAVLQISTPQGEIVARVFGADPAHAADYEAWLNVPAQFVGVMSGTGNELRQLSSLNLVVASPAYVRADPAGIEALFRRAPVGFTGLLRNTGSREPSPRVAVRGVVALVHPGDGVFLVENENALWVQTPQTEGVQIGDVLAVAGYPVSEHDRISLADGIVRPAGHVAAPAPRRLSAEEAAQPRNTDALVAVEGEVLRDAPIPGSRLLTLRSGKRQFVARVLRSEESDAAIFAAGTLVRVTGILEGTRRDAAKERSFTDFELLARTDADLTITRAAPWLSAGRLRWLVAALLGSLGLAVLWAWLLRRQVRRQTRVIEHQVQQETIATERQRIARELHDTLEQQLVGVQIQLNALAYRVPAEDTDVRTAIGHASAMLEHSRQEMRRSVWELRSQLLEEGGLAGGLRSLLLPLGENNGPAIALEVRGDARRLDRGVELHVLRIAQEAVANAFKHAHAAHIAVTLDFSNRGLQLSVTDDGTGFDPASEPAAGSLHFGLLGMRERAGKLAATLEVRSRPGAGTTIILTLPPS